MGKLEFDPQSLYDAVDAERRARGLTWTELSRDVRISTTTIKSMTKRKWGIELDGVIGLARWLGRTVESFAGGDGESPAHASSYARTGLFVRFNTAALYVALNEERERRRLTWEQVAAEIWPVGPMGTRSPQEDGERRALRRIQSACDLRMARTNHTVVRT
jgi:transcriptional regulator with XRE-family HTH domain